MACNSTGLEASARAVAMRPATWALTGTAALAGTSLMLALETGSPAVDAVLVLLVLGLLAGTVARSRRSPPSLWTPPARLPRSLLPLPSCPPLDPPLRGGLDARPTLSSGRATRVLGVVMRRCDGDERCVRTAVVVARTVICHSA